jgi:hypothetical protein
MPDPVTPYPPPHVEVGPRKKLLVRKQAEDVVPTE